MPPRWPSSGANWWPWPPPNSARQWGWQRHRLAAPVPVLALPTDRPRPRRRALTGGSVERVLPSTLADGLRRLVADTSIPLPSLLLGAYALWLHRISGQERLRIAVPTATARARPGLAGVVGYLVNPMLVESHLDPARPTSVKDLLTAMAGQVLAGLRHQPYPFPLLVAQLAPHRDPSIPPLAQTLFAFEDSRLLARHFTAGELAVERLHLPQMEGQFDLSLTLIAEDGLRAVCSYDDSLFDAATVERLLGGFEVLLAGIVADPDADPARLPLLTAAEREQLRAWNATDTDYPADKTVVDLFEQQVAATPDNTALVFEGETLSYAALDARANRLAHALIERGVGPDVLVALCAERSIALVVGLLGILKAGGAYVPLDPDYPQARLDDMLADSGAAVLLTQTHLRGRLAASVGSACAVLLLDDAASVAGRSDQPPERRSGPEHLAYCIYTSGSTGQPKGALNAHRGLTNRLLWMQHEFGLDADEAVLHKTPFGFDVSVWELLWPLLVGARMVIARPGGHRDPAYLSRLIDAQGVDTLHFVPSMLYAFLDQAALPTCLKRIVCSGEALSEDLQAACFARLARVALSNLYGPTEAAIDVTAWRCDASDGGSTIPIGRPIANTRIYILNEALQPQPIGIPGELCIAGSGLARGYLNRPELTAEKFIKVDILGRRERLYRTGDLARWRADGNLEYLGRLDHQIKLRGFRIELGEIEAVLAAHPAVAEAAVVLHTHHGEPSLAAYVRMRADADADLAQQPQARLRDWLKARLPDYMLPASFTVLDSFPLTPNGKLDRKALPEPEAPQAGAGDHQGPRDTIELALTQLWEEVLDVRPIGVNASFFDLGGHSLLAVKLMAGIEGSLGQRLPLAALFETPTIAVLARLLQDGAPPRPAPHLVAIQRAGAQIPLYCLPGAGGHVLSYHPLSMHLGREQPVFGLQTPGVDGDAAVPASVAAHAEQLLHDLRRHRPRGPYRLAGYSSGGKVAFELARRLEAAGETVTALVILDTRPDADPVQLAELKAQSEVDWTWQMVDAVEATYGVDLGLDRADLAVADPVDIRRQLAERAAAMGLLSAAEVALSEATFAAMRQANLNHVAAPCDGVLDCPILLFRAEEQLPGAQDATQDRREDWGWQARTRGPVVVQWVPGNHSNMLMEPHVQTLAEALRRHLEASVSLAWIEEVWTDMRPLSLRQRMAEQGLE